MRITTIIGATVAMAAVTGCTQTAGTSAEIASTAVDFQVNSVSVSPLTLDNICTRLGGRGAPPTLTIRHSPVAGVPIRIRMWDQISNGTTFEHRRTRVTSDGTGTTVVNHRFLPPCNTTGNTVSSYRFDVTADGNTTTTVWGGYDSRSRSIR
ncbi:MAG: hypothetical protein ACN6I5_06950 [Hyphomicrobiales bacterium]